MQGGGGVGAHPHKVNWANFNYAGTGMVNSGYTAHNLNPNTIPDQNYNNWSDPNSAAPNFNGDITVDTASLTAFSKWITSAFGDANSGPLASLIKQLDTVAVAPGSFYYADQIRSTVNGTGTGTGLKNQFIKVLTDLLDGLTDITTGIKQLVLLYANTEDLNSAQATKLQSAMSNSFAKASGEFNTLGTASQPSGSGSS
jgi:hypothetical protein